METVIRPEIEMKDSNIDIVGKMPLDWNKIRLKYLVKIKTGNEDTQNATPNGRYRFYVRSPIVERCDRYTFEGEGILVAGDGAGAGRVFHMAHGRYAVHQRVYCLFDFKYNAKFIHYYLESLFPLEMDKGSAQSTVPSIRLPMLLNFNLVLPDTQESLKIVDYLDKKCCKIDAIISETKASIDEYKELKQSMIFKSVTKGLEENVEMKDSGSYWIGEIPLTWQIIRTKYVVKIENGSDPSTEGTIPVYGSGTNSFKTCGEYKEGPTVLLGRKGATLHIPHYIEGRYWNVDTAFNTVPIEGKINLKYFYYVAGCFDYNRYISQTTLPSMTQTSYKDIYIPYPPIDVQNSIALWLDDKMNELDSLIAEKESLINDLEAYKKSLIYEVVTGKRRVV